MVLSFAVGTSTHFAAMLGRIVLAASRYPNVADFLLRSVGDLVVQVSLIFIPVCVLLAVVRYSGLRRRA